MTQRRWITRSPRIAEENRVSEPPAISVIVATYRRPQWLGCCLQSLARAEPPCGGFEVLVVDDGGGLPSEIEALGRGLAVTGIRLPQNQGQTVAQAAGVRSARGRLLALLDDDAEIHAGWLRAIEQYFASQDAISAVVGRIEPLDPTHILVRMRQQVYRRRHRQYTDVRFAEALRGRWGLRAPPEMPLSDHLSGGNAALRREVLGQIGGLPDGVRRSADDLLSRRLLAAGQAIGYNPQMIIYHRHNQSYREMVRQAFREGMGREKSRVLAGGGRSISAALAIAREVIGAPLAIRSFPELLAADGNPRKVWAIFSLHQSLVALGKLWQFVVGLGDTSAAPPHDGHQPRGAAHGE
jgi:GT2 family glycosyltransferase